MPRRHKPNRSTTLTTPLVVAAVVGVTVTVLAMTQSLAALYW